MSEAKAEGNLGRSEADPYLENGEFGKWLKNVRPDSGEYHALSDMALFQALQYEIINPLTRPERRAVMVAAMGALVLQQHNNRKLSGYISAEKDLNRIVNSTLAPYHEAELRRNALPVHKKAEVYRRMGGRLKHAMDTISLKNASTSGSGQQTS